MSPAPSSSSVPTSSGSILPSIHDDDDVDFDVYDDDKRDGKKHHLASFLPSYYDDHADNGDYDDDDTIDGKKHHWLFIALAIFFLAPYDMEAARTLDRVDWIFFRFGRSISASHRFF